MLRIDKVFKRLFGIKVEVVVNAPVERMFDCVADIPRYGEWLLPGTPEKTSEGPVGVGSTFTFTPRIWWFVRAKLKLTEFVAHERLAWEWETMGIRLLRSFELQPAGGGTRITHGDEWLHFGPFLTVIAVLGMPFVAALVIQLPIFRALHRWDRRGCLRRIESRVAEP
jgi:uncharacterized protein YndB with AHSA1/START domain